ncbi:SO_0444 family Cu/Zn efflux transporter [Mangrovibacterium lignilyticum]|uniref:SO_0444 family Cu/Zn efflux transporter n=1 Tax=Mangrovibacterium lignilyticum TaxID=2668052 RepID=UPI0013D14421|nr:SO_0444 family Cu/Zn efflux transporter [Mangrovibacterium lignilyticum]
MKDFLLNYINELVYLLNEMAPWLLLGLVFAGLLKVFFPEDKVQKYMGKSTTKSAVNASLLGIPMPLCSCGVIPTGISFFRNGASKGATNSFLISTPQTGVDSIFATYSMLGWPFAVLRPIVAFVTGIAGGILTNWLAKEKPAPKVAPKPAFAGFAMAPGAMTQNNGSLLTALPQTPKPKNGAACDDASCGCHSEKPKRNAFVQASHYAFIELLQDIAKWLIIGFLIAALISVLLPDDFFTRFHGLGFVEILVILAASVPIYICATGSIPIAAVLLLKGVSPGAALVFLMAGPATNVATISVIGNTMGRKSLFVYLGTIIGGAVLFGMLTNWLIPADFILSKVMHIHSGEHEMVPMWLQITSSVVLIGSLIFGYFYQRFEKNKQKTNALALKTLKVEGMTCSHCEASVTRNLLKIADIDEVIADKNTSEVKVSGKKIDLKEIEKVIEAIGYHYKGEI